MTQSRNCRTEPLGADVPTGPVGAPLGWRGAVAPTVGFQRLFGEGGELRGHAWPCMPEAVLGVPCWGEEVRDSDQPAQMPEYKVGPSRA